MQLSKQGLQIHVHLSACRRIHLTITNIGDDVITDNYWTELRIDIKKEPLAFTLACKCLSDYILGPKGNVEARQWKG